jgi:hypothetical protein
MTTNEGLDALYDRWKRDNHMTGRIARHGLIDEGEYRQATKRVVVLGKDIHASGRGWASFGISGDDYDLPKMMRHRIYDYGLRGKPLWKPSATKAGLWAHGILTGFRDDITTFTSEERNKRAARGLQRIGWTNLSKIPGNGKSDREYIQTQAREQKDVWIQELVAMDPEVIVFSGTFDIASSHLGLKGRQLLPKGNGHRGFLYSRWRVNGRECLCVDFYHHASRFPIETSYR